jgi:hypothetical protein
MGGVEWVTAQQDILKTSKHRAGTFGVGYLPSIDRYFNTKMTLYSGHRINLNRSHYLSPSINQQ